MWALKSVGFPAQHSSSTQGHIKFFFYESQNRCCSNAYEYLQTGSSDWSQRLTSWHSWPDTSWHGSLKMPAFRASPCHREIWHADGMIILASKGKYLTQGCQWNIEMMVKIPEACLVFVFFLSSSTLGHAITYTLQPKQAIAELRTWSSKWTINLSL